MMDQCLGPDQRGVEGKQIKKLIGVFWRAVYVHRFEDDSNSWRSECEAAFQSITTCIVCWVARIFEEAKM